MKCSSTDFIKTLKKQKEDALETYLSHISLIDRQYSLIRIMIM
jgi:hypothetical protein